MIALLRSTLSSPTAGASLNKFGMQSLAALLILAQLPHILHLPIWISLVGISIVVLRLVAEKYPANRVYPILLSGPAIAILAFVLAGCIYLHFGYFLGRDPCVGFLFLLVACKFAELKRPADATLLMCLSGFLLLTQYFYAQNIVSALVTIPAVFALGNALAATRNCAAQSTVVENLKQIGRLLLQGAPLAILLFIIFPRLPGPLWSLPQDAMAKSGLSDTMAPGSISQLSLTDEVAFRVEFDGPIPPVSMRYFRGPVLPNFDGRRWSMDEIQTEAIPAIATPESLNYTVTLQPHRQHWMFALEQPLRPNEGLSQSGGTGLSMHYTVDRQLLSREPITTLTRYRQSSALSTSYYPLRRPPRNTLALPNLNTQTVQHAKSMFANSSSPENYINNVLKWFNEDNFSYTLTPTLLGDKPVDDFLFSTKEGFCEHYAQAFVVMMRAAGIPARVVTGYLGGKMNGDYMIVRQSDAHAWAEAFVNGQWRRYDPTGAVAPSRVETGLSAALPDWEPVPELSRNQSGWLTTVRLKWDSLNHNWQRLVVDFNNDSQEKLWEKIGFPKPKLWQLTSLILVMSGVWVACVLGIPLIRGRRSAYALSPSEMAWKRFIALLGSHGLTRHATETPSEFIERAASTLPAHAERIRSVGSVITQWRFAQLNPKDAEKLEATVWQLLPRRWSKSF